MIRASLLFLICLPCGYGLALWLQPSPLVSLSVLALVCGVCMLHSWGVSSTWLAWLWHWRARQRITALRIRASGQTAASSRRFLVRLGGIENTVLWDMNTRRHDFYCPCPCCVQKRTEEQDTATTPETR